MNEERGFLAALAAHPEDETARGVYADWLDERERYDEAAKQRLMAPGYRAMAAMNLRPDHDPLDGPWGTKEPGECWMWWGHSKCPSVALALLPSDWFDLLQSNYHYFADEDDPLISQSKDFWTEQSATDAAALAFAELPAERQAELLATEVPA